MPSCQTVVNCVGPGTIPSPPAAWLLLVYGTTHWRQGHTYMYATCGEALAITLGVVDEDDRTARSSTPTATETQQKTKQKHNRLRAPHPETPDGLYDK